MVLGDFHCHSRFSDGQLSIAQLVDLYGQRGFGALAITDHLCETKSVLGHTARWLERTLTRETLQDYQRQLRREANRAWREYRLILIPGVEITKNSLRASRSAHFISLGTIDDLDPDVDVPSTLRQIRAHGGISIAAHPVNTMVPEPQTLSLWSQRESLASLFDRWEVASGSHLFDPVLQSGYRLIASSDLHHPRQISSWKTILHCPRDRDAIFAALRHEHLDFTFYHDHLPAKQILARWQDLGLSLLRKAPV